MFLNPWGVKPHKQFHIIIQEEFQYNKHLKINPNLIPYGLIHIFILTPITINSSLPLNGFTCVPEVIVASLMVP